MEDELRALFATLRRVAPHDVEPFPAWWAEFEAQLGQILQGVRWPTEREVREAGEWASKKVHVSVSGFEPPSHLEIAARRMAMGEPVAESYLFGSNAHALLGLGLVDRSTMNRYRQGAFNTRRENYGEAHAGRWLAEMLQRHEDDAPVFPEIA